MDERRGQDKGEKRLTRREIELQFLAREVITADFSVVDPYRIMHTDGSTEKPIQPVVHA